MCRRLHEGIGAGDRRDGRARGARRGGAGGRLPRPHADPGRGPRRRVVHAPARIPRHVRPLGGGRAARTSWARRGRRRWPRSRATSAHPVPGRGGHGSWHGSSRQHDPAPRRRPSGGRTTMRYEAAFLSADEQARVHEDVVADPRRGRGQGPRRRRPAAPRAGGRGGRRRRRASCSIPPSLVEAALATAPRSFDLGARNPAHDYADALARDAVRDGWDGRLHPRLRHRRAALRHPAGHRGRDARLRVLRPHRDGLAAGRRQRPARGARGRSTSSRRCSPAPPSTASTSCTGANQAPYLGAIISALAGGEDRVARAPRGVAHLLPGRAARPRRQMLDAYLDLGEWDVPVMRAADAGPRDHGSRRAARATSRWPTRRRCRRSSSSRSPAQGGRSCTAAPSGPWTSGPAPSSPARRRWASSPRR